MGAEPTVLGMTFPTKLQRVQSMRDAIFCVVLSAAILLPSWAASENVRSCAIPEITTIVRDTQGQLNAYQDPSRRIFKEGEQVSFQALSGLTGYYTVAYIDDGKTFQVTSLLNDPSGDLRFPCKSGRCTAFQTTKDEFNQKYDDIVILYTPCISKAAQDMEALFKHISAENRVKVPSCAQASAPSFSEREIFFSFETRVDDGCPSLRTSGPPTFKKRIEVNF